MSAHLDRLTELERFVAELEQRLRVSAGERDEAIARQTATADVLKVISRSAFDLQAVFDTLTASAVDLCGAFSGTICVRDGDVYRYRGNAGPGVSEAASRYLAEHPASPGRGSIVGRVLLSGKMEAIPDILDDPEYVVPLSAHGQVSRALLGCRFWPKTGSKALSCSRAVNPAILRTARSRSSKPSLIRR